MSVARIQWCAKFLLVYDQETGEELHTVPFTGRGKSPRDLARDWCEQNGYRLVLQESRVVH